MNPTYFNIRWRLFWASLFAVALALVCFALAQWVYAPSNDKCAWAVEEAPADPADPAGAKRPKAFIRAVIQGGPAHAAGIADGDELVAIHDLKISEWNRERSYEENRAAVQRDLIAMQAFINRAPDGAIVPFTVVRDGERLSKPVELRKGFDVTNAMTLLTGLVAWGIGLLVVLSAPQRKVARLFFYLGILSLVMAAAYSTRGGMYTAPAGLNAVTMLADTIGWGLLPPVWFHLFLRFPHGFALKKSRWLLAGLYALNVLLLAPEALSAALTIAASGEHPWRAALFIDSMGIRDLSSTLEPLLVSAVVFRVALLAGGIALFAVGTFKMPRSKRRALMAPLLFTVALFLNLLAYQWFAVSLAEKPERMFFLQSSYFFFLPLPFLPIVFAVAILRHGLLDVRRVMLRWLTYFVSLGTLVVGYLALLAWLFAMFMPEKMPRSWLGVLMGLLALPMAWTLRWMMSTLRRKFRRDSGTARESILAALRDTKNRFSEAALLETLVSSIQETFRPQVCHCLPASGGGAVVLPRAAAAGAEGPGPDRPTGGDRPSLRLPPSMLRHARESRELVYGLGHDESDWLTAQGGALRGHVDALGPQVMVLLMAGDRPHSVLLLGGKYSELNYSRDDRELLREVAIAAGMALESAAMHTGLLDKSRVDQELKAAREIQEALTSSEPPDAPGFQIASRLIPALETGGDLLWVTKRSPGRWLAAVGDVSGKGLAAAIYMSQATALLNYASKRPEATLDGIMERLDSTMRSLMGSKDFLTLSMVEWEQDGRFRVVRAGHPPPLHLSGGVKGRPTQIAPPGVALGMRPASPLRWSLHEGTLEPGEWLAMYSDGITEAMSENGEIFGTDRLGEQLCRFRTTGSPRAACEAVFQRVAAFEAMNRDDRTLFILARDTT